MFRISLQPSRFLCHSIKRLSNLLADTLMHSYWHPLSSSTHLALINLDNLEYRLLLLSNQQWFKWCTINFIHSYLVPKSQLFPLASTTHLLCNLKVSSMPGGEELKANLALVTMNARTSHNYSLTSHLSQPSPVGARIHSF